MVLRIQIGEIYENVWIKSTIESSAMLGLHASRELPVNIAPLGSVTGKVLFGSPHELMGEVEILAVETTAPLTISEIREVHAWRLNKRIATVVIVIKSPAGIQLFGPTSDRETVTVSADTAKRVLQSVLSDSNPMDARRNLIGFYDTLDSSDMPGVKNKGLFASHHLRENLPSRSDWQELASEGQRIAQKRRLELIESLGFKVKKEDRNTLILESGTGESRVLAVLLEETENFEAAGGRFFPSSPVAWGLSIAADHDIPWLIVLKKDRIRLHPGKDGVGVGQKGQAETYLELNLSQIDEDFLPLLPLVFSASALAKDGQVQKILDDSSNYAADLGTRLRERVYEQVVPSISVAMAKRIQKDSALTVESLQTAYALTLRTLFRILFQAYAEDRGLLPAGRNQGFDENSLKTLAKKLMSVSESDFGQGTEIWQSLTKVWQAIDQGNPDWNVPAYNGGLFGQDKAMHPEGYILSQLSLTDAVMGPALQALLIDLTEEGVKGPVDFRSLSVREFGTIYEGLLESSLSLAQVDLTVNNSDAWVPAKDNEKIIVEKGEPYFHSSSGDRKATGSYFTPKFLVDYLVQKAIDPTLDKHLNRISEHMAKGDQASAAREFFNFRVADLAMGSAHFLVAAVDRIEAKMRSFLSKPENAVAGVIDELNRLKVAATEALHGDEISIAEIEDPSLLRRQIARRCVYGIDINPMAVELSRLAIWIHTFVPGLPMSSLNHNLVCGNSLTGIGLMSEAFDALRPNRNEDDIFVDLDQPIYEALDEAKDLLSNAAALEEASARQVKQVEELRSQATTAASRSKAIFDAALLCRIGKVDANNLESVEKVLQISSFPEHKSTLEELNPAHMPYLFPEVFAREDAGFDVLIGNPPWEQVRVDIHRWWNLHNPGLVGMSQDARDRKILELERERPDLKAQFELAKQVASEVRNALLKGPFPDLGKSNLDLYQPFVWQNWRLLNSQGQMGVVVPRGALSGSALFAWRRQVLERGSFEAVILCTNNGGWLFKDVHHQYGIAFLIVSRAQSEMVSIGGPLRSRADFERAKKLTQVPSIEFSSWSSSDSFPNLGDERDAEVLRAINLSPRFSDQNEYWHVRATRGDINGTSNKDRFSADLSDGTGKTAIWAGGSYNLWSPDYGQPFGYANPDSIRTYLVDKINSGTRNRNSPYFSFPLKEGIYPFQKPRISVRWITNQTNVRTCITCLVPPMAPLVDSGSVLIFHKGSSRFEAFLLGVMSSIPYDWSIRRWVEMNFTFEILYPSRVPHHKIDTPQGKRLIEVSGRLAAVDDRYLQWASEVGVAVGTVTSEAEKADLIAQIDALVAILYGLTEDQLVHIFDTFHKGWKDVDRLPRLQKVLAHFNNWKDK